jgi:hypothetical protein
MHKVICEEPRHGGGPRKFGRRASLDSDLLPKIEGMRRPHRDRKWFGEHLSPLRRWLRSQVGRRWDDVYSEACSVIMPDSVVRNHIKFHLLEFVQRHTFVRNGQVWCFTCWSRPSNEKLVDEAASRWSPFYVHPRTGFLCEVPSRCRELPWNERAARKRAETCRWVNERTALLKLNGLWFECEMQAFGGRDPQPMYDVASRASLETWEAAERYGKHAVCVRKRQLSREELRRNGLINHPE